MEQINIHRINYSRVVIVVLLILLALLLFRTCETSRELDKYIDNEGVLKAGLTSYELKNGKLAYSIGQLQYSEKELKNKIFSKDSTLAEMAKKYSKVTGASSVKVATSIPKVGIKFDSPLVEEVPPTGDNPCPDFVFTEKEGSHMAKWYNLGYRVTNDSLVIEPFNTWTDIKRIDGVKKKWFLGKATPTTEFSFTNPYVTANEVQVIVVPYKKPFYDTRLFNIGVGIGLGLLIK